jgi:two-component system, cell cycle sensor histidine kinase and response regulator CckA
MPVLRRDDAQSAGHFESTAWEARATPDEFRRLIENASDVITLIDRSGAIRYASPSTHRLLGYPEGEMVGRSVFEFLDPSELDSLRRRFAEALSDPTPARAAEYRFRHRDGTWRVLEGVSSRLVSAGGDADLIVNARDVTERRLAERRQRDTEQQYRALFDLNPLPMWLYDRASLRFLAVNDAAVEAYGYSREQFLGLTIKDIRPPEDVPALADSIRASAGGDRVAGTWRHRRKNGTLMDVAIRSADFDFAGWPARLVLAEDVSEKARLEEQLRQVQKLDAMGRLAGGVAHDFNNLLFVITGYSEQHLRRTAEDDPSRARIGEILKAAQRAAGLTRQLLTFSRHDEVRPKVINLNAVVRDMEPLFKRLLGAAIEVDTTCAAGLGRTRIDPTHIEQVLMNLVVNARDAMPTGGRLSIQTANAAVDAAYAAASLELSEGQYVMLAVSDTGSGIPAEVRDRIFEPFFTTKEKGSGTGLGLSIVYGIVKQAGGRVAVYSEPGHGTSFKIYLPRVDDEAAAKDDRSAVLARGSETVLLVEDDEAVREITRESLVEFGYHVLEARDGTEALAVVDTHGAKIDLLITDMVIGRGQTGRDVAEEVLRRSPRTRVVVMSGYAESAVAAPGVFPPDTKFLSKPLTLSKLLATVRAALDMKH